MNFFSLRSYDYFMSKWTEDNMVSIPFEKICTIETIQEDMVLVTTDNGESYYFQRTDFEDTIRKYNP